MEARIEGARVLAMLAEKGIEVADADALFGGITISDTPLNPNEGVQFPETDPIGFNPLFDIPGSPATPYFINPGDRTNAVISFFGDTDWFRMQLVEGQTYQANLTALPFAGLGDPLLFLLDQFGNTLDFNDNFGVSLNSQLTFTATRSGLYFLAASGGGSFGPTVGNYQITLNRVNFSTDTVGDTRATAGTIAVDTPVLGTIDSPSDTDLYKVTLEKGKSYYVVLDSLLSSPNPLGDPRVEVLDSAGNIIAQNDDNGITRNSFIAFDVTKTGTFYIRAAGAQGTTGDFRLSLVELEPPPAPDMLKGVDWGVKFNKTQIRYYFADAGESVMEETSDSRWSEYEKGQAAASLREFSSISRLTFVEVNSRANADFVLGKSFLDSTLSGKMAPQDPEFGDLQGQGWFNTRSSFWSDRVGGKLEKGAYGYSNFIHEYGHGLGLSHPHDDGGGTSLIFPGVRSPGDVGELGLNQTVFTVMSYNSGWRTGPAGGSGNNDFGFARTPMAFDIAVIQRKYGANMAHRTGDDEYTLVAQNARGTGYEAIWDAGGNDTIRHDGTAPATINLNAATLQFEEGGGGFVSFVAGIFGGFTIANGVVIENAIGGSGADRITGNRVGNLLDGRGGSDTMNGLAGADTMRGGGGADKLSGGDGNDRLLGQADKDTANGGKGSDLLDGGAGNDTLKGGAGNDTVKGGAGLDRLFGDSGNDLLQGGDGNDRLAGGAGRDTLDGGKGDDILDGGAGNDTMTGGAGRDTFVFSRGSGTDRATDFSRAQNDRLQLDDALWTGTLTKRQVVQQFAEVDGGNAVFDFGSDKLVLTGVNSLSGLEDFIVFA
jgi:Ca2+-binding RTX toxin-like protein